MKKLILTLIIILLVGCEAFVRLDADIKIEQATTWNGVFYLHGDAFGGAKSNHNYLLVEYSIENTGNVALDGWYVLFDLETKSGASYTLIDTVFQHLDVGKVKGGNYLLKEIPKDVLLEIELEKFIIAKASQIIW